MMWYGQYSVLLFSVRGRDCESNFDVTYLWLDSLGRRPVWEI